MIAGRVLTGRDAEAIDHQTIEGGVPSLVLMERAGAGLVRVMERKFKPLYGKKALIICGRGNNGGDGLVIARHLFLQGVQVKSYLIGGQEGLKADPAANLDRVKRMGLSPRGIKEDHDLQELKEEVESVDFLIDAIFGIGLHDEVRGIAQKVIEVINNVVFKKRAEPAHGGQQSAKRHEPARDATGKQGTRGPGYLGAGCDGGDSPISLSPMGGNVRALPGRGRSPIFPSPVVISVDIPSGVDSDNGRILGVAIRADLTVTFVAPKFGLLNYPGAAHAGQIEVVDIGVDEALLERESRIFVTSASRIGESLIRRQEDAHKGEVGRILVVAGSLGMSGAAILSAKSALVSGAGLVYVAVPGSVLPIVSTALVEMVGIPMPENPDGSLAYEAYYRILDLGREVDALLVGPGLSQNSGTQRLVREILLGLEKDIVLDADGLNALTQSTSILKEAPGRVIITPHPGELSRLIGRPVPKEKRLEISRETSAELGVICVLKGARTLITEPGGRSFVNLTGNSGMATAGSGDVLAGIIVSLIAQHNDPFASAVSGVYLHGLAGDLAAEELGASSIIASDIIRYLPGAFEEAESPPGSDTRRRVPPSILLAGNTMWLRQLLARNLDA
ncbi:hypothetical protein HKBW3S42_00764 [Candidatus Hakubella thermalkaliphila]|uniref:Multifunctional fusion protein n=1 Tax=Candidatus Hakubella thermalkaliphila TaxID=2754717 RepID=A0A6V8PJZ2_9ACTN|nr:hypothetical protein HKBW3S42_00764 [Candidatus Hakubella thermalkaliphila]